MGFEPTTPTLARLENTLFHSFLEFTPVTYCLASSRQFALFGISFIALSFPWLASVCFRPASGRRETIQRKHSGVLNAKDYEACSRRAPP